MPYPDAPRLDVVDDLTGPDGPVRVPDPYRWLEDADDPRTQQWSQAQDLLCREHLDGLPGREHLDGRLRELLGGGSESPPSWRGERRFLTRRRGDQQHGVLLVVEPDGTERVLVDPVALDSSGATTLDAFAPSKEGDLLAVQLSVGGDEESRLRVLDVATGELVDGPVDRVRYSPVAWLPGGRAFVHVRRLPPQELPADEVQYHRRVWLHRVGTPWADDVLLEGDGFYDDMTHYFGVQVSLDGRWVVVSASAGTAPRDDVWLAPLSPTADGGADVGAFTVVQRGVDARCDASVARDGRLWVLTDEGAPRGRLAVADPRDPTRWEPVLPEDAEAVLEDVCLLDGSDGPVLLVLRTRHAVAELSVHDARSGEHLRDVDLGEVGMGPVSAGGVAGRPEGGSEAWFAVGDFSTQTRVLRHDVRTGATDVWAVPPGEVAVPAVVTRHLSTASADGTTVRYLVVSPEGEPDRARPTVLYGYGGFGISLSPAYSASVLAWVEAGGTWVVAQLRGGGEEGEAWHRGGMREDKTRVFEDLEAVADALVQGGWTAPGSLGISGGSNGGLLVGAALTRRPRGYAAVVCSAPLLDMVRYERFGLGVTWNDEYGSAKVPEELGWLLSYSPYHHVVDGERYPATLFTVFDGDTRVDPLHGRKLAAALQHATSADPARAPVLVRQEAEVGHGARSVDRTVGLSVDTLAFLAAHTGLALP